MHFLHSLFLKFYYIILYTLQFEQIYLVLFQIVIIFFCFFIMNPIFLITSNISGMHILCSCLIILYFVSLWVCFWGSLLLLVLFTVAYITVYIAQFWTIKYITWKFVFRKSLGSRFKVIALCLWREMPGVMVTVQVVWCCP